MPDQILDQIIQLVLQMLENGEEIEPELEELLIEILKDELQSSIGTEAPTSPPIEPAPIGSSTINSFGYDPQTQKLKVKFQGDYPQQNGPVYEYDGVPQDIFALFRKGAVPARTDGKNDWGKWWKGKHPSLGASMHTLIKEMNYPYRKVA